MSRTPLKIPAQPPDEALPDEARERPVAADAASRMAVRRLTLTDFRSYPAARIETDPRPVVLTGPNGAGKTNLLEAVSLLVPGRGLRQARLSDLPRHGAAGPWGVAARLDTPAGPVEIGTGGDPAAPEGTERRLVRINGAPARGQAALAAHVSAVWLTPQMDRLFLEGAAGRRRFLDRLVYGFDADHAARVSAYENAMRQRARLLREGPRDPSWLTALEEVMADRGVAVAAARLDLVDRLNAAAAESAGPFPCGRARAAGTVEDWLVAAPAAAAEARFRDALLRSRPRDGETGGAAVGPHRSDLEVADRARSMPAAQCSTGEQKALLIALVLAAARLQAAERGAAPLLLFDEVAAHLDAGRRAALFEEICALGAQAWLTGTEPDLFAPLDGRAQFFQVQDGALTPI